MMTRFWGLALVFSAGLASAATSTTLINFQGKLLDPTTNNPKNGSVPFLFTIYADALGTQALWGPESQTLQVTNGVFTAQLGAVSPLSAAVFAEPSAYLGVQVSGDAGGDMKPRPQLATSPYAFSAAQLLNSGSLTVQPGSVGAIVSTFTATGNLIMAYGISVTTGSFSGTGGTVYSLTTSSGINVQGGTLLVSGASGGIQAQGTGIIASTGIFTGGSGATPSILTSSGIQVNGGAIDADGAGGVAVLYGVHASTFVAVGGSGAVPSILTSSGIQVNGGAIDADGAGGVAVQYGIVASTITVGTATVTTALYLGASTIGCPGAGCGSATVIWLTNANAGAINAGSIVVAASANSFNTSATAKDATAIGVLFGQNCASGAVCPIAISGVVNVLTSAAVTVGQCVLTSTTGGSAESVSCSANVADIGAGIGRWLQTTGGAGTAAALLW